MMTFLFLLGACSPGGADSTEEEGNNLPDKVTIGYLRLPNDELISKTEEFYNEYFDDKGIETDFIVFDSGVEANQAFASGSVDFASMGHTNGVVSLSRDLDVELIWLHQILGELVVRNDSGIEGKD